MGFDTTLTNDEMRLLDHTTLDHRFSGCPNPEASALFAVLKDMLGDKEGIHPDHITVDGFLMMNLVAVAKAALMRDRTECVPGEPGDYDYIVIRTTKAVVAMLNLAFKEGLVQNRSGKLFFNNYRIPDWYLETRANQAVH